MQQIDTLINAHWIVPVEPAGVVLDHHALAIDGDRIVALLPQAEAEARYQARNVHDLPAHALIPGLVNAHSHAAMTLLRGYADDLPLMTWLSDYIWPAEGKHVGAEFVHDGSLLGFAEMLRGGVTCVSDMYFFPEATARAALQLGMRVTVGMPLIEFPSAYAQTPDEYLKKGLALHDQYRGHPLISTALAPHAPYTVSDASLRRVRALADQLDIPIHMHIHETAAEVERGVAETGQRPLARLHDLGLLSPTLIGVHLTQLTDAEIALIGASGMHVVHCPHSNLKLASGFCPVQALHAAGVNVAIGTDSAASNNSLDLLAELRTAAMLAKAVANDAAAIPAHAALAMATINGARALGLADQIGSLEPGKAADVVAVDFGGIDSAPIYHPLSQLVYASNRNQISDVWIAGRQQLRNGSLINLDTDPVLGKARAWRDKIA
ncbi:MAG TPA: TRZ/ATZ family hydrolase, partial [Gammaproteobacteria bacterium]|nr:TRZ/ATZ family hydrolase [Gammaproteobacteria bacterium]